MKAWRRRACRAEARKGAGRRGGSRTLSEEPEGFNRFVIAVRNLPILDLANPSLKINQIMPANLYDDVIFTTTPKVDRCTTCHLGIDKKGYETAPQPYRTHPEMETYLRGGHAVERIGCTACHQGRGRATSFVNAVHTPATREQEKSWGRYSGPRVRALAPWNQCWQGAPRSRAPCPGRGGVRGQRSSNGRGPEESTAASAAQDRSGEKCGRSPRARDRLEDREDWIPARERAPGFSTTRSADWDAARPTGPPAMQAGTTRGRRGGGLHHGIRPRTYPEPPGRRRRGQKAFENVGCWPAPDRRRKRGRGIEPRPSTHGPTWTAPAARSTRAGSTPGSEPLALDETRSRTSGQREGGADRTATDGPENDAFGPARPALDKSRGRDHPRGSERSTRVEPRKTRRHGRQGRTCTWGE